MISEAKVYAVNAFASNGLLGNPAGVCIYKDKLSVNEMQRIAKEIGFSNTAFVRRLSDNHYDIKWYTPISDAPLCGHATLGTMHILTTNHMIDVNKEVIFESASGQLIVSKSGSWYNLNFPAYEVVETSVKELDIILNPFKPTFVGEGSNCIFIEVENVETLRKLKPNLTLLSSLKYRALIATAKGEEKYDFYSRYFAPKVGINEDPVCASAHCRLIPYWSKKLNKHDMLAVQASPRGGVIKCQNLGNRVLISGEAVTVYQGSLISTNLKRLKDVT
jgi:PhzF family phenazine biosynthesis protein